MRAWWRKPSEALEALFLAALWLIVALKGFGGFGIFIATGWTIKVIVFERHGYRLITRGWAWAPSKDPSDYR